MERTKQMRKTTTAEKLAAQALGREVVDEVELDVTSTADVHAARLTDLPKSRKPAGMATYEWYARRALGEDGPEAA